MGDFARSTSSANAPIATHAQRERIVRALIGARRVHNRLDWWQPEDWLDSDAWTLADADGALLIVPACADEAGAMSEAGSDTAWLRWCAVADGRSASSVMRRLFEQAVLPLRAHGVASVWVIADPTDWISPYLADAGFVKADRMLTYQIALPATHKLQK